MKCLVTGAAGFIGSHLSELLLNEGHEVVGIDNLSNGRKENLATFQDNPNFTFLELDIRDRDALLSQNLEIDWIFHLAALADIVPSIEKPELYYDSNVTGTFNILKLAEQLKVKRFVYTASSSCYGLVKQFPTPESESIAPEYPYALTKYMGEQLVMHWHKVYGLPTVSLRLFNVYGPRSRTTGTYGAVFGVFLAQKLNNKPFTVVGDGTQTRDFTYVTDVAQAFYAAANSNVSGEIFNVGSGEHHSINQLVEYLGGEKVNIPKRPAEPDCTFADTTKILKNLDWKPKVPFDKGVQKILEHIDCWKEAPVWEPDSIQEATQTWFKYLKN